MAEQQNNNQNSGSENNYMDPNNASEIVGAIKDYVDSKSSTIDITYNGTTKTLDFAI